MPCDMGAGESWYRISKNREDTESDCWTEEQDLFFPCSPGSWPTRGCVDNAMKGSGSQHHRCQEHLLIRPLLARQVLHHPKETFKMRVGVTVGSLGPVSSQHPWNIPQFLPNILFAPHFPDLVLDFPAGLPGCEVCLWPGLEKDCSYFLHSLDICKAVVSQAKWSEFSYDKQGHCLTGNSYVQAVTRRHWPTSVHAFWLWVLKHAFMCHKHAFN